MAGEETFQREAISIAESYGKALLNALRDELVDAGKIASGSLVGLMETSVRSDTEGRMVIELSAEPYLRYVDKGRRPGKFPPISAIKEWTRQVMIPERAAFPIARKIAMEGIPALNVVDKAINKVNAEFLPEYEQELARLLGVVIVNDVFSMTNTKGRILPKSLQ